ncbi:RRM domain-containing protein [Aphelenchoides fujianensis]|nr:RRM domain-containing protein [Aphelenchoides fujianensis]
MEMDIAEVSLDDIIAKNNKGKGFRGGRGGGGDDRRQNDGPRGGAVAKKSKQWGHDKFFELANGGGGGRSGGGGGGGRSAQGSSIAVCRFSNIPFHITQDELRELFANYKSLKSVVLHHDDRGNSLGTAEVRGPSRDIQRLHEEFNRCKIDGRTISSVIMHEGGGGGSRITERVSRSGGGGGGGGDGRRRSDNGGRVSGGRRVGGGGGGGGGGARSPKKQKLTAEELDRELDEYMKNKTS